MTLTLRISSYVQLFLVFMLCVVFLSWLWKRKRFYIISAQLPGPFSLPLLGIGYKFMCKRQDIFSKIVKLLKEHARKPLFGMWLGPKFVVVVSDPNILGKLVQSSFLQNKDDVMVNAMEPFIGEGLLTGSGPKWRAHRRVIIPRIGRSAMESFAPVFSRETAKMADKMAEKMASAGAKVEVDLEDYLHPCIIDIVCQTVLGTSMPARNLESPEEDFVRRLCDSYECIMEKIAKPWLGVALVGRLTGFTANMGNMAAYFRGFIRDIILKKQNELRDDKADVGDRSVNFEDNDSVFSPLVVEILKGDDTGMSTEELVDEMLTLFLASSDPTTNTSCFILLMLAMHPDKQARAVEEIHEVLGEERRPISYDDCSKLTFVDNCIRETIRLFQTGPFSIRKSTTDIKIDDKITLPKGVTVLLNYFSLHRSPLYWKHPNEFHPDHFLPEEVEKRHPNVYIPFSGGPRSCVGKLFAMAAIKIIVANVLWKYRLSVKSNVKMADLRLKCDISIVCIDGYKVFIEKRT